MSSRACQLADLVHSWMGHSDDIKQLFCRACDLIGVETRPVGAWQISVARRDSVARLNEFLGPKA